MSGGLDISGGNFLITQGTRNVVNTAGHLILGIPSSAINLTQSITFPDVNKAQGWNWQAYSAPTGSVPGGEGWTLQEAGFGYITALPQEWSSEVVVEAAPAGANAFLGLIRINRTTSPTKTWIGNTVDVKVPVDKWIPNCGSLLLESEIALARSMTLYINSGGNLAIAMQQSVSSALPGGWNDGATNDGNTSIGTSNHEAQWISIDPTGVTKFVDPGWPVYNDGSMSVNETYSAVVTPGVQPAWNQQCNVGGSQWINFHGHDPTNYESIYSIDIQGEFVRLT